MYVHHGRLADIRTGVRSIPGAGASEQSIRCSVWSCRVHVIIDVRVCFCRFFKLVSMAE